MSRRTLIRYRHQVDLYVDPLDSKQRKVMEQALPTMLSTFDDEAGECQLNRITVKRTAEHIVKDKPA